MKKEEKRREKINKREEKGEAVCVAETRLSDAFAVVYRCAIRRGQERSEACFSCSPTNQPSLYLPTSQSRSLHLGLIRNSPSPVHPPSSKPDHEAASFSSGEWDLLEILQVVGKKKPEI